MLLEGALAAVMLGLALVLAVVALVAYRRTGQRRLLLVGLAFVAFAAKGGAFVAGLFLPALWAALQPAAPVLALDLGILLVLYGAVASP